ncbi:unnamed protein product, partial [marine sediment metagenome]
KGQAGLGVSVTKTAKTFDIPDELKGADRSVVMRNGKPVVVKTSTGEIVGKASSTTKAMWDVGLKGKYDIEKETWGIELSGKKGDLGGGITLTQPRKGKPYVKLDTYYKYDDYGNKIAVGVTMGKGKPNWKFSAGVAVGKDREYRINFDAATVGSHLDNWNVGLTKYSVPAVGKKKEKQLSGKYKYDPDTQKGRFEFDTGTALANISPCLPPKPSIPNVLIVPGLSSPPDKPCIPLNIISCKAKSTFSFTPLPCALGIIRSMI